MTQTAPRDDIGRIYRVAVTAQQELVDAHV